MNYIIQWLLLTITCILFTTVHASFIPGDFLINYCTNTTLPWLSTHGKLYSNVTFTDVILPQPRNGFKYWLRVNGFPYKVHETRLNIMIPNNITSIPSMSPYNGTGQDLCITTVNGSAIWFDGASIPWTPELLHNTVAGTVWVDRFFDFFGVDQPPAVLRTLLTNQSYHALTDAFSHYRTLFWPGGINHDNCYHHEPASYGYNKRDCDAWWLQDIRRICNTTGDSGQTVTLELDTIGLNRTFQYSCDDWAQMFSDIMSQYGQQWWSNNTGVNVPVRWQRLNPTEPTRTEPFGQPPFILGAWCNDDPGQGCGLSTLTCTENKCITAGLPVGSDCDSDSECQSGSCTFLASVCECKSDQDCQAVGKTTCSTNTFTANDCD